jgi:hypothetical protein
MEMSGKTRAFTLRKEVNHLKRVLAEKKFSLALKHTGVLQEPEPAPDRTVLSRPHPETE